MVWMLQSGCFGLDGLGVLCIVGFCVGGESVGVLVERFVLLPGCEVDKCVLVVFVIGFGVGGESCWLLIELCVLLPECGVDKCVLVVVVVGFDVGDESFLVSGELVVCLLGCRDGKSILFVSIKLCFDFNNLPMSFRELIRDGDVSSVVDRLRLCGG